MNDKFFEGLEGVEAAIAVLLVLLGQKLSFVIWSLGIICFTFRRNKISKEEKQRILKEINDAMIKVREELRNL